MVVVLPAVGAEARSAAAAAAAAARRWPCGLCHQVDGRVLVARLALARRQQAGMQAALLALQSHAPTWDILGAFIVLGSSQYWPQELDVLFDKWMVSLHVLHFGWCIA